MLYTQEDVFSYVEQEDVKFIRLVFCDAAGRQKNIAIMPQELKRAFSQGISFDGSAVGGFSGVEESDLFLFPIPETLTDLPWRPSRGKVVRMLCNIRYPDGRPYPMDCRALLANAVREAKNEGITVQIGAEFEFYLFKTDADGNPTTQPFDHAGYMDVAPEDKGENVRREICLMLESMGISPESSHHEEGPGQNEIDFRYSDAITAADQCPAVYLRCQGGGSEQWAVCGLYPKAHSGAGGQRPAYQYLRPAGQWGAGQPVFHGGHSGPYPGDDGLPESHGKLLPSPGRAEGSPFCHLVPRKPLPAHPHSGGSGGI